MKNLLGCVALATCFVAPAMAADIPVKAAPVAVAAFSWTGCYIGGNAGINQTRAHFNWGFGPGFPDTAAFIEGRRAGADATLRSTGFTGGGGVGCNLFQTGSWVWGIEVDLQAHTGRHTRFQDLVPFGLPAGNNLTESFSTRWLATARPRVGFTVTERVLVYGTGGVAFINVNFHDHTNYPAAFNDGSSPRQTRFGWVAGAGIEYAFSSNWSGKIEYLHADFGNTSFNTNALTLAGAVVANAVLTHNHRLSTDIVRVGLNYRFGSPIIARY